MISDWTYHVRNRAGYSVVETLTAIAIGGVLAAAALPHIDTRRSDIHTTVAQLVADYRWARNHAIVSGVHYSVEWTSSSRYQVKRLKKDAAGAWVLDAVVKDVMLPATVTRLYAGIPIEFNTRGLSVTSTYGVWVFFYDSQFDKSVSVAVWPSGQTYEYS